jgi:hypothetical protein
MNGIEDVSASNCDRLWPGHDISPADSLWCFHISSRAKAGILDRTARAKCHGRQRKEYFAQQQQRQTAYAEAAREFARVLVMVSTPLGVAAILIGAYLSFQAIGTGLILGGILTVSWGYWSYWLYLDDWIRFIALLAGLAIRIFVGIRPAGAAKMS